MAETVLLLGPLAFRDFEVASGVSFGGVQRLARHDLPGGLRVIDAMGDAQSLISISGTLSGPEATSRARALAAIRSAGAALPLTWDVFFYSVVVETFEADYQSAWWIPFRLTCAVVRDEAYALIDAALSLTAVIASDLGAAATAAGADLSSASAAVAVPGATTRGTGANRAATNAVSAAGAGLNQGLASAEGSFSADALFTAATAASGVSAIAAAGAGAQRLSALAVALAYVGRASANLRSAGT